MMARLLAVSPSGYYEWRGRPPSARAVATQQLLTEMRTIHRERSSIQVRTGAELSADAGYFSEDNIKELLACGAYWEPLRRSCP